MTFTAARPFAVGLVYASSVYVQALAHASVSCALFSHELIFAIGSAAMAAGAVAAGWLSDRLDRALVLQLTLGLGIVAMLAAAVAHRSDTFLLLGVSALAGFLAGGAHVALVSAFEASPPRLRMLLYLAFPISLLPVALSLEVVEEMPVWASVSTGFALMAAAVFSIFTLKHATPDWSDASGQSLIQIASASSARRVAIHPSLTHAAAGAQATGASSTHRPPQHVRRPRPSDGATLLPSRALRRGPPAGTQSSSPATPASPGRRTHGTPSKGQFGRGRLDSASSISSTGSLDGSFALVSAATAPVAEPRATASPMRPAPVHATSSAAVDNSSSCPACSAACARLGARLGLLRCLRPLQWSNSDALQSEGLGGTSSAAVADAADEEEHALLVDSSSSAATNSAAAEAESSVRGHADSGDASDVLSLPALAPLQASVASLRLRSATASALQQPLTDSEKLRVRSTQKASMVALAIIGCLAVARSLSSLTFFVSPREPLLSDAAACAWRFPPPANDALTHGSSAPESSGSVSGPAGAGSTTVPLAPFGAHVIVADALALVLSAAFMSWKGAGRLRTASIAAVLLVAALLVGCFALPSYLSRDVVVAFGGDPSVEQLQLTPGRGIIESIIRIAATVAVQAAFLAAVEFAPASSRGTVAGIGIALLRLSALLTAASVTYAEASLPAGARIITGAASSGAEASGAMSTVAPPPPPAEPHLQWTDYALQSVVGVRGLLMLVAPQQTPMSAAGSEAAAAAESLSAYASRAGQAAAGTLLLCALLALIAAAALAKLPVETRGLRLRAVASEPFSIDDDSLDGDAENLLSVCRSCFRDICNRACHRTAGTAAASHGSSVQLSRWSGSAAARAGTVGRSGNGFTALDVVPEADEGPLGSPQSPQRPRRSSDQAPLSPAIPVSGAHKPVGWKWPEMAKGSANGGASRGGYQPLDVAAESAALPASPVPGSRMAPLAASAALAAAAAFDGAPAASAVALAAAAASSGASDSAFDIWDAPPQLFNYAFVRRDDHDDSAAGSTSAAASAVSSSARKLTSLTARSEPNDDGHASSNHDDRHRASSTASGFDSWRAAASGVGRALSHVVAAAGDVLSGRHSTADGDSNSGGRHEDASAAATDLASELESRWHALQAIGGGRARGLTSLVSTAASGAGAAASASLSTGASQSSPSALDTLLADVKTALRDARMKARRLRREADLLAEEAAVAKAHGRQVRRSRVGASAVESDESACAAELVVAEAAYAKLQTLRTAVEEAVLQMHLCARAAAAASTTRGVTEPV